MLNWIRVNGFRSLIEFEVKLQPGLNIIVGTNGSGKSNFISFLDFLSKIVVSDLNSAIAISQGAGSVFSKEAFDDNSAELSFKLSGRAEGEVLNPFFSDRNKGVSWIDYEYSCSVIYRKNIPAIYISHEELSIDTNNHSNLKLIRKTTLNNKKFSNGLEVVPKNHPLMKSAFSWRGEEKELDIIKELENRIRPDRTFMAVIGSEVNIVFPVIFDISRLQSINIDPTLARKPTPVGSAAALEPTGEGLAGALYQLERGSYNQGFDFRIFDRKSPADQIKDYKAIVGWCKEINPDVERLFVELDFQEAMFRPFMYFSMGDRSEQFPLVRVSDGTVKWLALTTALLSESSLSIIEEPENFLHPFMQESFIALCRDVISASKSRTLILSTHSPTLLNCCKPSELIIFESIKGRTKSSPVQNMAELEKKINNSRFGLGYFYRTGGVYGEGRRTS